jgi:hypothetical protein
LLKIEVPKASEMIFIAGKYDFIEIPEVNGIYYLFNNRNDLLYVGKSKNLRKRIKEHVKGSTHTKMFHNLIFGIQFSVIDSELETELLETYLINRLNPRFNKAKRYSNKKAIKESTYQDSITSVNFNNTDKTKYINLLFDLLCRNKNKSINKETIEQVCAVNFVKFISFYDATIYHLLLKNNVTVTPRSLTLNT